MARLNPKKLFPKKKTGNKWYCRVCGKELTGRKENFCSDSCKHHFAICCWPSYARREVQKRDKGHCRKCGLDTAKLWERVSLRARKWRDKKTGRSWQTYIDRFESLFGLRSGHGNYWEADHIVPVEDGGAKIGLKNFQTLCLRCHKAKTAAQSKLNSRKRKKKR